jgi:hypothetical protein
LKEEFDNLQKSYTLAQVEIINLEKKLFAQEYVSYDGTLAWKITNVLNKMKNDFEPCFISPFFYTHQYGYKMCAKIYLNGDGSGKNSHVSIFLANMRDEYDSIQEWPVKKKVTVRLIDQINEGREDVEKDFIMHLSSKLSKNDTSRALGLPKFCSLQRLNSQEHDYVKNDCLFIELRIDSANLVETIFDDDESENVHIKFETKFSNEQK